MASKVANYMLNASVIVCQQSGYGVGITCERGRASKSDHDCEASLPSAPNLYCVSSSTAADDRSEPPDDLESLR